MLRRLTGLRVLTASAVAASAVVAATGTLALTAPAAAAAAHTYPVKATLDGRTAKKLSNHAYPDRYPAGSSVTITCQAYGEYNYDGSAIWDRTTDGLWVPDPYVKTGTDGFVDDLPRCDDDLPTPSTAHTYLVEVTLDGRTAKKLSNHAYPDKYKAGTYVTITCQAYGEYNYKGSAIWDKTTDGLWVADPYVKTGTDGFVPGLPRCDNDQPSGGGAHSYLVKETLDGRTAKKLDNHAYPDRYRAGTYVTIKCQAYGEQNYNGSYIWDKTTDNLWVADPYVKTGTDGFVDTLPRCDNDPPSGGGGTGVYAPPPAPGSVPRNKIRSTIVGAARAAVGISEWGDNCNPFGRSGVRCGDAWCTMFASWTRRMAGIDTYYAYGGDFYYWGRRNGLLRDKRHIRPGDIVVFGGGPQDNHHTAVVTEVRRDGRIVTVEGNWGNAVRQVGPFDPVNPGPTHENIYGVIAPFDDSASAWPPPPPFPKYPAILHHAKPKAKTLIAHVPPAKTTAKTATEAAGTRKAAVPPHICHHPTVKLYPGTPTGGLIGNPPLRLGEFSFHVDMCTDALPETWKPSNFKKVTNTTGDWFGYSFKDGTFAMSRSQTADEFGFANYHGELTVGSCLPKIPWPCAWQQTLTAEFQAVGNRNTGEYWLYLMDQNNESPLGDLVFWETP